MIIRSRTLEGWMRANFDRNQLKDIARYGCSAGFPGLTYYSDTCKLYDKFSEDIWKLAENGGCGGDIMEFIASLNGTSNVSDRTTFENLMVWFACEETARELTDYGE